jgi:hypothetical protein
MKGHIFRFTIVILFLFAIINSFFGQTITNTKAEIIAIIQKSNYNWQKNIMYFATDININKKEYTIRDLWNHKDIGTTKTSTNYSIPAHGVLMVRLSLTKK